MERLRPRVGVVSLGFALCLAAACSSSGSPPSGGTGGESAIGGAPGTGGTASGGNSGAGGVGMGGMTTNLGGAPGSGGASAGGTNGGAGGSATGGRAGGTGGAGAGGGGGGTNCVGRAISMSANGTGTDSDAALAEVTIDLGTALPIGNAHRTIEFWAYIKPTDWVGDKNEIYYTGGTGTATAFGMDFGTNTVNGMATNHATLDPFIDGGFSDDSRISLGIDSATAQWVHIAMTWDGTAMRTYVNGTVRLTDNATAAVPMLATKQGPLIIGCNPENSACFNGWFDEFRVWNVARTDQQIMGNYNRPLVGNEAGLVGYWKFDDAVGSTTAADSVMGQPAHAGMLKAAASTQMPTFITPNPAPPLICP
jgi:hypothetical protein